MDLDEPERFTDVDPGDALGATLAAPERWQAGAELAGQARLPGAARAVVVAGMGGSGITGDLVAAAAREQLALPVLTVKDATLPAFVGPETPVIAVSHSGATEETVAAAAAALEVGAPLVAVTGGGPLASLTADGGGQVVTVPEGGQPRHALGYLAGAVCAYLGLAGDIPAAVAAQRTVVLALGPHAPTGENPAKQLAAVIAGTGAVHVWGTSALAGAVALRFASQLAEHAKLPATVSLLPEVAHNEVLAWAGAGAGAEDRGLVVLRDPASETPAAAARVEPALGLVAAGFAWHVQRAVGSPGDPPLARLAGLCLAGDLVSVYTAIARDTDPTPITAIDRLKAAVAAARTSEGR